MKNILIASNTDGAHFVFRGGLINFLCNEGHKVDSLTLRASPENIYEEQIENISGNYFRLNDAAFGALNLFKSYRLIRKVLRGNRYDVIHLYGHELSLYFFFLMASTRGCRVLITFTGLGRFFAQDAHLSSRLVRKGLLFGYRRINASVHKFFFLNEDDRSLFCQHLNVSEKAEVLRGEGFIPQGSTTPDPMRGKRNRIDVLFASRFLREKGVLELINSIECQRNQNLHFFFAGSISHELASNNSIEKLVQGRIDNAEYLGHVSDMPKLLNDVDVVILPTYYKEGAPRILIEALAHGKYVITTTAPGARETVLDGKNGRLITPKCLNELIESLEELTREKVSRAEKHSKALFSAHYDHSIVVSKISQSYFD